MNLVPFVSVRSSNPHCEYCDPCPSCDLMNSIRNNYRIVLCLTCYHDEDVRRWLEAQAVLGGLPCS